MNIEWVWLLHYMELRYHWLPEAWWCAKVIHSPCWLWGDIDEYTVKNPVLPRLGWNEKTSLYYSRLTHILPTYIQAARPHETSCCLDWSRWAMCMRSLVLLPFVSQCHSGPWTWGEQALGRGGWSQSLLRCGRAVMRQSFILQTAEQEQPT